MNDKTLTIAYSVVAAIVLYSCDKAENKLALENNERVVAIVNYDKIFLSQLQDELNRFSTSYGISFSNNKEQFQKIARHTLDELILKRIYFQETERLKISEENDELDRQIQSIVQDYSKEDLERIFEIRNIDRSKWESHIKEDLLFEKLISLEVKNKIKVENSEIKSYYKTHSEEYMLPERVQALQIVVNNELEAEAIYNKLQEGEDFFKLAKSESVSPEGIHGGDLGFFSRGQMPKEFDDAVFSLKVNKFSKVIQTPYGYHIFKVVKKKRAKTMTFKEAAKKIKRKIAKEKEKKAFRKWVNQLKEKSIVVIKKNVLSDLWEKYER